MNGVSAYTIPSGLSTLWSRGFNVFHAKANLVRERRVLIPALSVGVVARTGVRNVGGVIQGEDTHKRTKESPQRELVHRQDE